MGVQGGGEPCRTATTFFCYTFCLPMLCLPSIFCLLQPCARNFLYTFTRLLCLWLCTSRLLCYYSSWSILYTGCLLGGHACHRYAVLCLCLLYVLPYCHRAIQHTLSFFLHFTTCACSCSCFLIPALFSILGWAPTCLLYLPVYPTTFLLLDYLPVLVLRPLSSVFAVYYFCCYV
jgi:hypothetical protein